MRRCNAYLENNIITGPVTAKIHPVMITVNFAVSTGPITGPVMLQSGQRRDRVLYRYCMLCVPVHCSCVRSGPRI